LLNHFPI